VTGSLNLIFRPVRAEDKPRVLEFTAHTWGEDDGDYIKEVFDDWLADPKGQFVAVEIDAQPVAIAKLTDMGDGELWLEGLRVDPAQRKQGIGQALHAYNIDLARRYGGRVLRYATGQDNTVSQTLGTRTGFQHVGNYRWHVAEASLEFAPPERLAPNDLPALRGWLASPLMRSARGLYPRLWKWGTLTESRLTAHLDAGQVFGLRSESGVRAWVIAETIEAWDEAQVHHLDGSDLASMVELARSMRRLAADAGRAKIEMAALDPSPIIEALREAGYRSEDFRMWILELRMQNEE